MAVYDNKVLTGDQLVYFSGLVKAAIGAKQDEIVFNTAYNASSNKAATMSDLSGKQDSLVFNTAYNASSNKVATMSDITTALGGITSFAFEIVQALPSSNISTSTIYLVPKSTSGTNQVYTEYAYINNDWEIIGDTAISIDTLSNSEIDTIWAAATPAS